MLEKITFDISCEGKKKKRFLMTIDTNTDGWELLNPLMGIVAKQRCSEIAGYSETMTSSSQSSEAILDSPKLST